MAPELAAGCAGPAPGIGDRWPFLLHQKEERRVGHPKQHGSIKAGTVFVEERGSAAADCAPAKASGEV
eukprot:CAMPEP_0171064726 /NCGR_PEP_ID=MMETSP0766_2-20121228/6462_1 /TAXON_ID=439317 /ORGANISM="Gambierdiscus australes, Strain CAWD 149" /LENGTH=67 /DNA_ID=CAMNT_0011520791 /DNA_START=377 /DNA_END=580 /DNA_ORIENTATION=+